MTYRILPFGSTTDRVRRTTGVNWWPKGLRWFTFIRSNTLNGRKEFRATYTIASKGRTGARDRQRLMAHHAKFHINALRREDR